MARNLSTAILRSASGNISIDADAGIIRGVKLMELGRLARFAGDEGKAKQVTITDAHISALLSHAGNRAIPIHSTHDWFDAQGKPNADTVEMAARIGALKSFRRDDAGNLIADAYLNKAKEAAQDLLWGAESNPEDNCFSVVFSYLKDDPQCLPQNFRAGDVVPSGAATTALFGDKDGHEFHGNQWSEGHGQLLEKPIEVQVKGGNNWFGKVTGLNDKYNHETEFQEPTKRISSKLSKYEITHSGIYKHIPHATDAGGMRRDTGFVHVAPDGKITEISGDDVTHSFSKNETAKFSENQNEPDMTKDETIALLREELPAILKTALLSEKKECSEESATASEMESDAGVIDADKKPEDEQKPALMRAAVRCERARNRKSEEQKTALLSEMETKIKASETALLGKGKFLEASTKTSDGDTYTATLSTYKEASKGNEVLAVARMLKDKPELLGEYEKRTRERCARLSGVPQ